MGAASSSCKMMLIFASKPSFASSSPNISVCACVRVLVRVLVRARKGVCMDAS
jgi:hypothetical protein